MLRKQQKKTPYLKICIAVWGNGTVKWMLPGHGAGLFSLSAVRTLFCWHFCADYMVYAGSYLL
jgi:hypothetical protein